MHAFSFIVDVGRPHQSLSAFPSCPMFHPSIRNKRGRRSGRLSLKLPRAQIRSGHRRLTRRSSSRQSPFWSAATSSECSAGHPNGCASGEKRRRGDSSPLFAFRLGANPPRRANAQAFAAPITTEAFRRLVEKKDIAILGEVLNQYAGVGKRAALHHPYIQTLRAHRATR
jgi:hypothetical protein